MKVAEASSDTGEDDLAHLERELALLDKSEKCLLKLFMVDDLSEDALREEAANLKRQKQAIEAQLQTLRRTRSDGAEHVDTARLRPLPSTSKAGLKTQCRRVVPGARSASDHC